MKGLDNLKKWFASKQIASLQKRETTRQKGRKRFIIRLRSIRTVYMFLFSWFALYQGSIENDVSLRYFLEWIRTNINLYFIIGFGLFLLFNGYLFGYFLRIASEKNYKKRKEEQNKKTDTQNTSI